MKATRLTVNMPHRKQTDETEGTREALGRQKVNTTRITMKTRTKTQRRNKTITSKPERTRFEKLGTILD